MQVLGYNENTQNHVKKPVCIFISVGGQDILDPAMPVYIGNLSENRYLKLKVYNIRRYGKIVFLNYRRGSQCLSTNQFWVLASFQSRNEIFFTRSRKSRYYAEAYNRVRCTCLRALHRQASDPAD